MIYHSHHITTRGDSRCESESDSNRIAAAIIPKGEDRRKYSDLAFWQDVMPDEFLPETSPKESEGENE